MLLQLCAIVVLVVAACCCSCSCCRRTTRFYMLSGCTGHTHTSAGTACSASKVKKGSQTACWATPAYKVIKLKCASIWACVSVVVVETLIITVFATPATPPSTAGPFPVCLLHKTFAVCIVFYCCNALWHFLWFQIVWLFLAFFLTFFSSHFCAAVSVCAWHNHAYATAGRNDVRSISIAYFAAALNEFSPHSTHTQRAPRN